jgi:hypothetical protein
VKNNSKTRASHYSQALKESCRLLLKETAFSQCGSEIRAERIGTKSWTIGLLRYHEVQDSMNRAIPEELAEYAEYDSRRYVELLADTCATVLSPFGVSKEILLSRGESLLAWA